MTEERTADRLARYGRAGVSALAGARMSRFISVDSLGDWMIVRPLKRWALRPYAAKLSAWRDLADAFDEIDDIASMNWRTKLVSGLECPFCVGFWTMLATLTVNEITEGARGRTVLQRIVRTILSALAANYVAAHVSSRLDTPSEE